MKSCEQAGLSRPAQRLVQRVCVICGQFESIAVTRAPAAPAWGGFVGAPFGTIPRICRGERRGTDLSRPIPGLQCRVCPNLLLQRPPARSSRNRSIPTRSGAVMSGCVTSRPVAASCLYLFARFLGRVEMHFSGAATLGRNLASLWLDRQAVTIAVTIPSRGVRQMDQTGNPDRETFLDTAVRERKHSIS